MANSETVAAGAAASGAAAADVTAAAARASGGAGLSARQVQTRGEIPSLIDPPPRCPFLPRCPHAMEICHQEIADRRQITPTHWVRCHLYEPGSDKPIVQQASDVAVTSTP